MRWRSFAAAGCVAASALGAQGQVELRDGGAPLDGVIEAATLDGVTVRVADGTERGSAWIVGLDRVRAVPGAAGPAGEAAEDGSLQTLERTAERVWRARARLERGDWMAAEPLFEALAPLYRGRAGPTASVVARGLLECRLRRGAQAMAVSAWLETLRVQREAGAGGGGPRWIGGVVEGGVTLDPATGLLPDVPPMWLPSTGLAALVESGEWEGAAWGDGVVRELASLYRAAAAFELGGAAAVGEAGSQHPGVRFVWEVVTARAGDEAARASARAALRARMEKDGSGGGWIEAWCRTALGRSLVREADGASRRQGVIELLHVPARFPREQPYLAGLALAEAAVTLAELGDAAGSGAVAAALRERFAGHPALGWERLTGMAEVAGSRESVGARRESTGGAGE